MSALDIAGAVVWTPLALVFWGTMATSPPPANEGGRWKVLIPAVPCSFAAVYSIARLCGATP